MSTSFEGASLKGENLTDSNMRGCNFRNADMTGVNLTRADMRDTDLTGAILRDAIVTGTDFRGAILEGTVFDGANREDAIFDASDSGGRSGRSPVAMTLEHRALLGVYGAGMERILQKMDQQKLEVKPYLRVYPYAALLAQSEMPTIEWAVGQYEGLLGECQEKGLHSKLPDDMREQFEDAVGVLEGPDKGIGTGRGPNSGMPLAATDAERAVLGLFGLGMRQILIKMQEEDLEIPDYLLVYPYVAALPQDEVLKLEECAEQYDRLLRQCQEEGLHSKLPNALQRKFEQALAVIDGPDDADVSVQQGTPPGLKPS